MALTAIATLHSGSTEPSATFAHMWWFDTSNNLLKQRNADDDAWVTIGSKVGSVWTPYSEGVALGVGSAIGDVVQLEDLGDTAQTPTLPAVDGSQLTGVTGKVLQQVHTETGTADTGTAQIPADDTTPQNTEGDEYMTLAVTPASATNILLIDVTINLSHSVIDTRLAAALFQDSTANALAVASANTGVAGGGVCLTFRKRMLAGTTSPTTFKVRAGSNQAGTTTFNGAASNRLYGGVELSSITITEIEG